VSTWLITYSIGGNDAGYADILRDCIGEEDRLPFLTCYDNKNAYQRVDNAFGALDGTGEKDGIHSYAQIFRRIRTEAEYAQVVQVGYPHLYPATGSDRTFLPGGRCEGVKKADQRWVVEKTDELNAIISKQAGRAGYLYASPSFDDHELCSGGNEWIFGIQSHGRLHPNAAGHTAIGAAVTEALQDANAESLLIEEGQRVSRTYVVNDGTVLTTVAIRWPGSDVQTTLVSPSGERYDRDTAPAGHTVGPASEVFTLTDPEPGTWTIEMFGADIDPDGEQVTYSTYQEKAPNTRPEARFTVVRDGTSVSLDASAAEDQDGTIRSYDWYVETADDDQVITGEEATDTLPENEPASVTLVVTDNRGLTDFHTVNTPGIKWTSAPKAGRSDPVTVALLSSPDLDARTLSELRWGAEQRRVNASKVTTQDANGDGREDLLLTGTVVELGLEIGRQIVCIAGVLPDENPVFSCVPVTLAAAPEPTATVTTEPSPTPTETGAPSASAGPPADGPSARAENSTSRGSLAGSGGPSGLVLMGGALIMPVAVGVLIAARRLSARS
jgi:GDSL-like Lipase/Acylhydrolase family